MPVGQSLIASLPFGALAGGLAGELAACIVEEAGGGRFAKAAASAVAHTAASSLVGYTINALGLVDVTGAAVTTVAAPTGGLLHGVSHLLRDDSVFEPFVQQLDDLML